jgi:PAS domain S-box-containing protein
LKEERELINIIAERLSRNTERKQAEEALKSSEEKFRVIFDHANDGMILADEETKKFYIGNNTICQMLGYSPEEIKKLGVADIHPKEDLPYVIEQFEKQVRREIAVAKDLPVKRKDGSIFYADVNTSLVTLAGRKYLLGLFRDITERKQAEVALRESEEKYRSLVQNIPDVVWTTDINGKTVFISPNVKKVYGYTPEEIFEGGAEVWFGRIHPDDTERLKKAYAALFKKGDLFDIEYRIKRKDGKWIWLHERAMEVYEKNGLKYTDGVFSDITERKQAEEELRKEKDKLEKYFEATGAMILFLSLDGKVLLINQNGCKTLGYEMDDILNKNWIDKFISEKDRVKGKNILDSIIREKTDTIKYSEITLLTKKREFLTVSLGSVLMKDEAGEGQAILNIGINTTELTEAKIAINQLKELNRLKDDFLNIAAHELKTPLTSIIGFSEILKGQSSSFSPEQQKQIDIINEESSRLNRIIKRMLAITRFESGREIITLEQFNLAAFIQSILPSLNVLLKDKKMKLVTDIEKNDIVIKTNKEKVLEVIYNFVDNALKYGLEEQTITISVTQLEKEWVKIAVKDQGVGIPPEKIDQLFGKFSQLEPSLTRSQEGTGMGLYICKIIIESLGGKIGVESTLGEGSVFYFILPVKKETEFPKR